MDYLRIYESKLGATVDLHPLHGQDELPANTEASRILADHGHCIELLPTLPAAEVEKRKELLWDVHGSKNPDLRIDNKYIADIKTPSLIISIKQSTINRSVYACAQQKVTIAIINLADRDYAVQDIKKGIVGALQPERNKTIEQVWIITKQRNIFKVERRAVFNHTIYHLLGELLKQGGRSFLWNDRPSA